jgi:hypothetical protein
VIRAFECTDMLSGVSGIAFAESAGRARMIACRSGWDAGFSVGITTMRVVRCRHYDNRRPTMFDGRFFPKDYLPEQPL